MTGVCTLEDLLGLISDSLFLLMLSTVRCSRRETAGERNKMLFSLRCSSVRLSNVKIP